MDERFIIAIMAAILENGDRASGGANANCGDYVRRARYILDETKEQARPANGGTILNDALGSCASDPLCVWVTP
jgi:hypothetical protein